MKKEKKHYPNLFNPIQSKLKYKTKKCSISTNGAFFIFNSLL